MRNEYTIHKLIAALDGLSNKELYNLADVFTQRDVGKTLSKLLKNVISLREAERRSRGKKGVREKVVKNGNGRSIDKGIVTKREVSHYPKEAIKNKFFEVLENRKLLPSTRTVVSVLNRSFPFHFNYEEFRKRGRKDLIKKCWTNLENVSPLKRREMLEFFFHNTYNNSLGGEGYHELFRILSQNE